MEKVSICIPAYNNAASLARLLESIRIQTFKDYRIYLTDDSDRRDVEELVSQNADLNLYYHKNKSILGPTANTNAALRMAQGVYVKIMHHDDCFSDTDSLSRLVELLDTHPEVDIAFCGTKEIKYDADGCVNEDESFVRCISDIERWQLDTDIRNLFLVNMIGAPSAVLVRNRGILMDERLKWLVDIDYYLRILSENPGYADCTSPLVSIGLMETQVTRSCLEDEDLIFRENGYVFDKFELWQERPYRRFLIRMALDFHKGYASVKEHRIGRWEYLDRKLRWILKKGLCH